MVISNVSPQIPNEALATYLVKIGIQAVSQISNIRASLTKLERSHILSFRRQVYVKQEEVHLIPESLQIVYEETPSWIYFSTDSRRCYACKQNGNTAKMCTSASTSHLNFSHSNSSLQIVETTPPKNMNLILHDTNQKSLKRPPSTLSENSSLQAMMKIIETKKIDNDTDNLTKTEKRTSLQNL